MKKLQSILAVLAITVLSCGLVQGTLLPPGSPPVVPSVGPGQPPPGAALVTSLLGQPFASASFSGTIDSFVYSGDPANPFPGGFDFVYQIHVTLGPNPVERVTMIDFTNVLVDVAQNVDGPGSVAATTADRTLTGNSIGWNFPQPTGIGAGNNSYFLEVRTNAAGFAFGTANLIDGSVATARILAPVPDGGSAVALLGVALAGIEFLRRKFKS